MRALGLLLFLCACALARATSVVPPSFDELVQGSSLVFRGEVTGVRVGVSGEAGERHPATFVTFAVERVLKGAADKSITLEFMGGELAGRRLLIVGLPRFVPGERGIFFIENQAGRLCPIMRLRHGRYRVVKDAVNGSEHVARDDGSPLRVLDQVSRALGADEPPRAAAVSAGGMDVTSFEAAIIARAQQPDATAMTSR